jgi:5,10-methylenetetrahydromethanopterin reductase
LVARFERYVADVHRYLAGDTVPFDDAATCGLSPAADLGLQAMPQGSALTWLPMTRQPKVPLDVACTGPRVITLAARRAERVTFAVGADPERIRWAVETARQARHGRGLRLSPTRRARVQGRRCG